MPGLAAYQATHLNPSTGTVKGLARLELAGLVYRATEFFRMGATAGQVQAWLAADPRFTSVLAQAKTSAGGNTAVLTDLQAITTL